MDNKSIAVVVFTYNQESLIGNTLDSIFSQSAWGLSQVIVGDDCSTDNTWDVLLDYKKRYPEIMFPIRNETNLGIYANLVKLLSFKAPSDLFFCTAGDDPICDGYFEGLQNYIAFNGINTNDAIGIYSDWKEVRPNGDERVFSQSIVKSGISLVSLFMRLKIYNRSIVVSQSVFDAYDPIILDRGLRLSEMMFDIRSPRFIKKVYYMPQVTTTYFTDIGVSTRLSIGNSDYFTRQSKIQWEYFLDKYAQSRYDKNYCKYEIVKSSFITRPTWGKYVKMLYYYLCGLIPHAGDTIKSIVGLFYRLARYKVTFKAY